MNLHPASEIPPESSSSGGEQESSARSAPRRWTLIVILVVTALFSVRMLSPSDLMDPAQGAPIAYVLDVVHNGHWLIQRHISGAVTSKPPLYTWLAALTGTLGGVNRFTLCLPAFLSVMGLSIALLIFGRKYFGWRSGFAAAIIYTLSPAVAKQVAMARMDGLFCLLITLAAFAAWKGWHSGKGWTWFWLICAAATLTKGPLGVLLGAAGLLAAVWERLAGHKTSVKGSHWLGVILFFAISGGWFWLAYREVGQALIDKMLVRELYEHAVGDERKMGHEFHLATLYFLSRFAPWSLFSLWASWRVCFRPSPNDEERCLERFLFCWFFTGLVIFSVAAHQRGDLIFPLIPPAALLAGREIARLLSLQPERRFFRLATGVAVLALALAVIEYGFLHRRREEIAEVIAVKNLAGQITRQAGKRFPIIHVDSPALLQMYLGTMNLLSPEERALELLAGNSAAFVVVMNVDSIWPRLDTNSVHVLAEAPRTKKSHAALLGNRPALAWADPLVTLVDSTRLEMSGVRQVRRRGNEFWFETVSAGGEVRFTNESKSALSVRVHFTGGGGSGRQEVLLLPGETKALKS